MNELPELGVRAHGDLDPRSCIAIAEAAEAHGFASLWFAENPYQRGLMPAASACAVATRRVRIGLGIVNPYTRHPSLIAMEFAALDELAEGRARLGIGSGIGAQIARLGFEWRPLPAMRDAIRIVRGLLAGEELSYRGRVFSVDRAKLRFRPRCPQTPIYMAAMGDRSLALCGEIADGLIVSNLCPLGYTERAVAIVARAAAEAGRASPPVVQYVPCVARPDREAARRAAIVAIGEALVALWPAGAEWLALRETIVAQSGIPKAEFAAALDRLRRGDSPQRALDDRFIDAFAIAGTAQECLARAALYRRAGATELVLTFAGPQPTRDIAYLGSAVAKLDAAGLR
jgi:5,10-methylenetetrahydromethanopterin reductase